MILAMKHKFFLNILYWDIHVMVHAQSEGPFFCQVNEIEKKKKTSHLLRLAQLSEH